MDTLFVGLGAMYKFFRAMMGNTFQKFRTNSYFITITLAVSLSHLSLSGKKFKKLAMVRRKAPNFAHNGLF